MLTEVQTRTAMAQQKILLTLMRRYPDMTDVEIATLTDAALGSPAATGYALGAERDLDAMEAISHADYSDVGRMIHAARLQEAQAQGAALSDHATATAGMSALQMLQYAHAHARGLK